MVGDSFSTYVGDEDSLVEEFDQYYAEGDPHYRRSPHVLEAMEMLLTVDRALDQTPFSAGNEHEKRTLVRQAIIDKANREFDDA